MLINTLLAVLISPQAVVVSEEAYLTVPTYRTPVAVFGDRLVTGDYAEPGGGAAYVYKFNGTTWALEQQLLAFDRQPSDNFGIAVAIDGPRVLIGADHGDGAVVNCGAAYVFLRSGSTWTHEDKLTSLDGDEVDSFGVAVSLDGDTALIGASGDSDVLDCAGSAYAFVRSGSSWTEQAKLIPQVVQLHESFGEAVAIHEHTALVGSPHRAGGGSAFVFVRDGNSWSEQTQLLGGPFAAAAGASVALQGDRAVVGSLWGGPSIGGEVYVHRRVGTAWSLEDTLSAGDGVSGDEFGSSVALAGHSIVVGAPEHTPSGLANAGSIYQFKSACGTWSPVAKYRGVATTSGHRIGHSVAHFEDTVVASSRTFDAVHVFRVAGLHPIVYCTSGASISGCHARLCSTGTPSSTLPSGFTIEASAVQGQRDGIFFWSTNGRQANPWGNGTSSQCVVPPVKRSSLRPGTGTFAACDGAASYDLNLHWTLKPAQRPAAGALVQIQFWYRDPLNTSNQFTSLSDAIEVLVY